MFGLGVGVSRVEGCIVVGVHKNRCAHRGAQGGAREGARGGVWGP